MKKEKSMNSLSEFPTEVLVFYFKKFRTVKHYEYENDWYNWVVEDKTEGPFYVEDEDGDGYYFTDEFTIKFEGMWWHGHKDEFMKELNSRGNVDITAKNFKKWKIQYKKSLKKH